jgi:hypothetical protein
MKGGGMDVSEGRIIRPTRFMTLPLGSTIGGLVMRCDVVSDWLRHSIVEVRRPARGVRQCT